MRHLQEGAVCLQCPGLWRLGWARAREEVPTEVPARGLVAETQEAGKKAVSVISVG